MSDFCRSDIYIYIDIKVLVATVAVGIGIGICDITMVIIWGLPPSLLQLCKKLVVVAEMGGEVLLSPMLSQGAFLCPAITVVNRGNVYIHVRIVHISSS